MPDLSCSPRVVGANRADFYNLETLLNSPQFKGKQREELALAIYNYFTSAVDGTYHFWPEDERAGTPQIRTSLFDSAKLLNAYGWMICGQCAAFLFALYRAAGLPTRVYGVPGHSLCEVYFDGRWHHLDVDMWTWFRTPDGHIASAVELARNAHALIVENRNKSKPCNLPDRTLEDYAKMYATTELAGDEVHGIAPPWSTRAHTMDFQLRPGETLIRSQANQGRFHMPQEWLKSMRQYNKEWRGHPRERYEPFRTFGNGRWIYEPKLCAPARDVEAGAWERSGLTQDAAGLLGEGSVSFRIQSPYPFCARPDWSGEKVTYADGVWLHAAGAGKIDVEVTGPEGKWAGVLSKSGNIDERVDISALLEARYECLVRIALAPGARLKRFRFEGFIMTAPVSLPRLVEGENPMELRCNDKHGLRTVPWRHIVDFRGSADLRSQLANLENAELKPYASTWQQIVPASSAQPLQATVRLAAPKGRTFAWVYALATIREAPPLMANPEAVLEWSADGKMWKPVSKIQVTSTRVQWDCSLDGEVMTDAATEVFLRVTTNTGVSALEFNGHINAPHQNGDSALTVTHRWEEDGGARSFEALRGAMKYTVVCGRNPRQHTIEMRC